MASKRLPGALCGHVQQHHLGPVNDGTTCRQPSPLAGTVANHAARKEQQPPPIRRGNTERPWQCGLMCTFWEPTAIAEPVHEEPVMKALPYRKPDARRNDPGTLGVRRRH
jgi:hypothetical protein